MSVVQPTFQTATLDSSRIAGRYRIEHVLAEGGMGTVYSVVDEQSGQQLALKRMRRAPTPTLLELFEREYRTLARIQHPRIIRVYDYGLDGDEPFYTMELVQGRDSQDLAPVPYVEACRYLRDVATCLALLHTRRLLHRDVTPRNVRVTPDGHCKLIDFGALTSFGIPERIVGTPPCVPPEALHGAPLDQRADLFALGALAYFMLTRRHAYPAHELRELPDFWRKRPLPPSTHAPGIPKQLDTLILGLLSLDPNARPSSVAEVVERLNATASLPAEDDETQRALAESYFVHPQFVGRVTLLDQLRTHMTQLKQGQGDLVLIDAESGLGRTRLLGDLVLQAQLGGLASVAVDAAMHRQTHGAAIALVERLIVASKPALQEAVIHAEVLCQLDRGLATRLSQPAAAPQGALSGDWRARVHEALHAIVRAACSSQPLLLVVDNLEDADEASLAFLAGLEALVGTQPLAIWCSASWQNNPREPVALSRRLLVERSQHFELSPFAPHETFELAHSLFGDAPNLTRFADWLHACSGGRPTHCMALVRTLHAQGLVRYLEGTWALPADDPESARVIGLDELLTARCDALSDQAQRLAESMAVSNRTLSRERAMTLARREGGDPFALLDELVCADVLHESVQGLRFTHGSLRKLLLTRLALPRRQELHRKCAEQLLGEARTDNAWRARIEAGWHLMQAGDETRGAELLGEVAYDALGISFAIADLQIGEPALEAALEVYTRQGRSGWERLPLLATLAHGGYFISRSLGERYGDEAMKLAAELSGVALGRRLQPLLGRTPGLLIGLLFGWLRFRLAPRRQRRYPFRDVVMQVFTLGSTLSGMYVVALDASGGRRPLATLDAFAHLPERMTPTGIREYAKSILEIAGEHQARALRAWERLTAQFNDPTYYRALPRKTVPAFLGGLWFARGVFESFRDGDGALRAASELERSGLKMYRLIASQIRVLYHVYRAELEQARAHARVLELQVLQFGSSSQIELWEPAAMILAYTAIGDVVELRRVSERLNVLAPRYPSLARYAELAALALEYARCIAIDPASLSAGESDIRKSAEALIARGMAIISTAEPRSFIGWGALCGYVARSLNAVERYAEAKALCLASLGHLEADDMAFVALFLDLELELAVAQSGLGQHAESRQQLEALLERHAQSDNPLTRGRLHEAYARSAALEREWELFRLQLELARGWYRRTGTPALLARVDALARFEPWRSSLPPKLERAVNDNIRTGPDLAAAYGGEAMEGDAETSIVAALSGKPVTADTVAETHQRKSVASTPAANVKK